MKKIQKMVEYELINRPSTRSSDKELIKHLYMDFYGIGNEPFIEVISNASLPKYESVTRARRKVQEVNEELRAVPQVESERIALQQQFIEYALEV